MRLPELSRRQLGIGTGCVLALAVSAVLLVGGGGGSGVAFDKPTTSGSAPPPAAPQPAPVAPAIAAVPAPVVARPTTPAGSTASRRATGIDASTEALEQRIDRRRPVIVPAKVGAAPRPSSDVAVATRALRDWKRRWQACISTTADFRKCDSSGGAGFTLINVDPTGRDFSISQRAGDGTVVTLAVVDDTECRALSTSPKDCDSWR